MRNTPALHSRVAPDAEAIRSVDHLPKLGHRQIAGAYAGTTEGIGRLDGVLLEEILSYASAIQVPPVLLSEPAKPVASSCERTVVQLVDAPSPLALIVIASRDCSPPAGGRGWGSIRPADSP